MSQPADPDNPAARLEAHFRKEMALSGEPSGNSALSVEAVGFARHQGDWLGVVITPRRFDLFLLNGGGVLWGDIPAGQRRYLALEGETLPFISVDDPAIGAYQYSPLLDDVGCLPDMATARAMAWHSLAVHLRYVPPPPPTPSTAEKKSATGISRRGFFRRLAGKR